MSQKRRSRAPAARARFGVRLGGGGRRVGGGRGRGRRRVPGGGLRDGRLGRRLRLRLRRRRRRLGPKLLLLRRLPPPGPRLLHLTGDTDHADGGLARGAEESTGVASTALTEAVMDADLYSLSSHG